MEIWAHTMVKNEARWLWYSTSSVINYVDKLLLCDTGSTDGSLEIEKELKEKYPQKIILSERNVATTDDFTKVRQEILDATNADWFLMLDGDEIWWNKSIANIIEVVRGSKSNAYESIIVPTINLVGDIFHYQEETAGRYRFDERIGHYNLRVINKNIPGLHSQGKHGVWGWADDDGKMIQDRNTFKFIDAPYLHSSFLPRSENRSADIDVIKRKNKLKYEIGENFQLDFYYPEVFFEDRPSFIMSPWTVIPKSFKFRAFFETPLRKIKRRVWTGKTGY